MGCSEPHDGAGVLIVDDEPQIVAALTDLLEDDYRAAPETSPQAALQLLREDEGISAILCGQRMARMNGDAFFAEARKITEATRILITGRADFEGLVRAVNEGGIYAVVTKPWEPDALKDAVRKAVEFFDLNRALRRERSLFDDLMRSISDGVFFKDAEGRYARLNEAEAAILNLGNPEDAVGCTLHDLLPPGLAEAWSADERAAMEAGGRACRTVRSVAAADGETRYYAVNMAAIAGKGGLVGVSRDVTEEKKIERMKDELASTVSHELRAPLTAIHGSLALLRSGVAGELPPAVRDMVEICRHNCERLLRLIGDILDSERLEKGAMGLDRRPVDLAGLLQEAVAANAGYGQPEGKTIALAGPAPSVFVNADRDRILQVLANLISNALKFSPPGGKVRLRARVMGDYVRVSVLDQGAGVPEEFRSRIFQRFSQADPADARRKGGAGLGLSISRSIIELHEGRINFRTRLNRGSIFYFELPIRRAASSSAPAQSS